MWKSTCNKNHGVITVGCSTFTVARPASSVSAEQVVLPPEWFRCRTRSCPSGYGKSPACPRAATTNSRRSSSRRRCCPPPNQQSSRRDLFRSGGGWHCLYSKERSRLFSEGYGCNQGLRDLLEGLARSECGSMCHFCTSENH